MIRNTTLVRVLPLCKLTKSFPLFAGVSAGFPSPADDYLEEELDLNDYLIKNPEATFFVRVTGDSMIRAGIYQDDILIVDCSLQARSGDVIVALIDGEFTVKRWVRHQDKYFLQPENPAYKAIELKEGCEFQVWGVVTNVIHKPYAL
ncbi:MAG TPA: translesion error-prone DNA polymerase V autoproteolytic subunit [Saprospiraceae bacterium]|nr:translesion error-prone DNA polymerase V autoproteolytic subunit [Saprospiraceae bacterium]HMQ84085.1 translesion error-prone DNA polymerase V autoproteolytic subunit [Saprospiraceae bacterium]